MTDTISAADVAAHASASHVRQSGDFLVDYDRGLGAGDPVPLAKVPVDARVDVTATVTGLKRFPGRVRMVLSDRNGATVSVVVPADHVAGRHPEIGSRIRLRGHVTQQTPQMPKGVAGYALRVVA
ncbi:hypothetical protein [Streptomyces odontomachi]|uniref:hypothetical protein n=1 Tax=Streptomyces odontomachi TaxID=2944940 RepID=UPI00210A672B|nr:hypothetical protein [Streptomyces sp. ODS25]